MLERAMYAGFPLPSARTVVSDFWHAFIEIPFYGILCKIAMPRVCVNVVRGCSEARKGQGDLCRQTSRQQDDIGFFDIAWVTRNRRGDARSDVAAVSDSMAGAEAR